MSLVAGIHLGDIALLVADRRVVTKNELGEIIILSDDHKKIIDTGIGYITGSGCVELLDPVKYAIQDSNITHTDQILNIISEEKEYFRECAVFGDLTDEIIGMTGWLFTYRTIIEDKPEIRVALCHPSLGKEMGLILKGKANFIIPVGSPEDPILRVSDLVNKHIKTSDDITDPMKCLEYHIPILREVYSFVSECCKTVSETFNIGVVFKDGTMMHSTEIGPSSNNITFTPSR
ncbi:MAG: hypothetical protein CXR30_16195 [Geobacter sp.]|nr:MAG: hypothetical protein CXR30_16195 [Geobacter sp.]